MDKVSFHSGPATKQGSKRKRTTKDSPPAANRTSRLNNDQIYDEHVIRNHSQVTGTPCFGWPISPSADTTETARSASTTLASSYTASLPSRQGHRETSIVGRHHGTSQLVQNSHPGLASQGTGALSCAMPIAYSQAPSCGSSNPTTASFDPDREAQLFYDKCFYDLGPDIDAHLAANDQRSLHPPGLVQSGSVFANDNRAQYQNTSSQGDQLGTTTRTNPQFHPGIVGSNNIQNPPSQGLSSFHSSLFGTPAEVQPSAYSTSYNPYQFVSDASTASKLNSSSAKDNNNTLTQSTVHTLAGEQNFGLPQSAMGGGELYLAQHCGSDNYAQFGVQGFGPTQPQPATAESLHHSVQLASTEPELSDNLLSSQAAIHAVSQGFNAGVEQTLTERRRPSQTGLGSDGSRPNTASDKNGSQQTKKRGPFNSQKRKATAETRKRKACLRCRVQKIRCDADHDEVGGSCIPCQSFSKVSKKTLHHVSCYRGKLTDVVLFRKGGLNLTGRWRGTEMKDVGDRINTDIRTIQITLGICEKPIDIKVVRFRAGAGDVVARFWTVREGERGDEVRKKKDLEPFCLVDIWATATYFEKYIVDNAIATMVKQHTPHKLLQKTMVGQDVIKRTYIAAIEYYLSLDDEIEGPSGKTANPRKKLLGSLFVLWHAIRHTTGSAYICGPDTLGMKPEVKDETYPLFGKVSVPRMILAQFDSINHTKLLSKYGHKVLRDLETFIFHNQSSLWWPIYLCVFILLHEASVISADRYRHARNNFGGRFRYSIPDFVEELQEGCNNILVHWHYYNCHPWPNPDEPWGRHKHFMSELSSEQHDLVMETLTDRRVQKQLAMWRRYRDHNGSTEEASLPTIGSQETPYMGSQTHYDWDHPCYWISQMFEERWQPHPTYQREYTT